MHLDSPSPMLSSLPISTIKPHHRIAFYIPIIENTTNSSLVYVLQPQSPRKGLLVPNPKISEKGLSGQAQVQCSLLWLGDVSLLVKKTPIPWGPYEWDCEQFSRDGYDVTRNNPTWMYLTDKTRGLQLLSLCFPISIIHLILFLKYIPPKRVYDHIYMGKSYDLSLS